MGAPVLIGAGIGAVGSAITGRDPLKGAMLGGSLGAGYGGFSNLAKGGSFMEGAFPFMGETTKAASLGNIAQGGGATMPAWTPEIGMANTFNTGANIVGNAAPTVTGLGNIAPNMGLINKVGETSIMNAANLASEVPMYSPAIMGAAGQGGLTAAATATPLSQQLGYTWDELKDLATSQNVGNVIGGMNVAKQYMQRPTPPQAPAGGVSRGNPPQVTPINELLALSKPQQRKRISLLG